MKVNNSRASFPQLLCLVPKNIYQKIKATDHDDDDLNPLNSDWLICTKVNRELDHASLLFPVFHTEISWGEMKQYRLQSGHKLDFIMGEVYQK